MRALQLGGTQAVEHVQPVAALTDDFSLKRLPEPIVAPIGAQMDSVSQARLGQAMCHDSVCLRLGVRYTKAATVLQSIIRTIGQLRSVHILEVGRGQSSGQHLLPVLRVQTHVEQTR